METPNIVFLVFDACRRDELYEIDGTFASLESENISCERALAPSAWSLPSHVSYLTGEHPSEHGICTEFNDGMTSLPVLESISEDGYQTYGISANAYFSPAYNFDSAFDSFWFTTDAESDNGLNISESIQEANKQGLDGIRKYFKIFCDSVTHDFPLASLYNLSLAGLYKFFREFPTHHIFDTSYGYKYSASLNTSLIKEIIKENSENSKPFFLFANYMDAHFPYYPHEQYTLIEEITQFRSDYRVNERTGHPFDFMEAVGNGTICESDLPQIKNLYKKEVKTLDEHLSEILTTLESYGLREETIVIVTADHGENLGEPDDRGYRRMGHHESVSDAHLTVPLVIAHPDIENKIINRPIESRKLATVVENHSINSNQIVESLKENSKHAIIECPAHKKLYLKENYPDLPDEFFNRFVHEHVAVAYTDDWKIAGSTDDTWYAWQKGAERDLNDAPTNLQDICQTHLSQLSEIEPPTQKPESNSIKDEISQHLSDLGYA